MARPRWRAPWLAFGGDYKPEQWPEDIWRDDLRLMVEAGVTLVPATALAQRFGRHPALALWHVGNGYGRHNAHCYCDTSAAAFRRWLIDRYGDLDALNAAWGTAGWSQPYNEWDEILLPRTAGAKRNPTQVLDFRRFSSDDLLACYRAERDALRAVTPHIPITTNFMVTQVQCSVDYWRWAPHVDIVTNDHHVNAADPAGHVEVAFSADVTRGLAGGAPWLLMAHSTSAVSWQARNVAKQPGELLRNSLTHVARGSDGALFFQWRASRAGSEKFHSGMIPHAGTSTKVWRYVVALGTALRRLEDLRGSRVVADVAMIFDWQAWWAIDSSALPSVDVSYLDQMYALYRALWRMGVTVDVVAPDTAMSAHRLMLAPTRYLVTDEAAARLHDFAAAGGVVLITYSSGIVDHNDHIRLGGYPRAFRDLLGIWIEEFFPLRRGHTVHLDDGGTASVWTELLHLRGCQRSVDLPSRPAAGDSGGHPQHGGSRGRVVRCHKAGSARDEPVDPATVDRDGHQTATGGAGGC